MYNVDRVSQFMSLLVLSELLSFTDSLLTPLIYLHSSYDVGF